jgi:hypothetical protein
MDKKMKNGKKYNKFLSRLAQANEEAFGDKKLECCNLKDHQNKKTSYVNDGGENEKK